MRCISPTIEKPTQKQIDFATTIAETVGVDLPKAYSKYCYSNFIDENIKEFYEVRNEIRYSGRNVFTLKHSYVNDYGFNGDAKLNFDPETI